MTGSEAGHRFAYLGVGVGLSISIAANVMHASGPGAPWWAPVLSGAWPLLLFLALEVLTRVQWAQGRSVRVARAGVAVVAAVAAALSYWHLRALLMVAGEDAWAATIGPLAIDGLMAVSAAALLTGHQPDPASEPAGVLGGQVAPVEDRPQRPPAESAGVPVTGPARRKPGARRKPAPAAPASDADLLAQVAAAVAGGQLAVDEVTGNRLRTLLGVGAVRAGRLADAWAQQQPPAPGVGAVLAGLDIDVEADVEAGAGVLSLVSAGD